MMAWRPLKNSTGRSAKAVVDAYGRGEAALLDNVAYIQGFDDVAAWTIQPHQRSSRIAFDYARKSSRITVINHAADTEIALAASADGRGIRGR